MPEHKEPMTAGAAGLADRATIKAIRELEGREPICSARSEGNSHLSDVSAGGVPGDCAPRSLGLMLKEIEQLAGVYRVRPEKPVGRGSRPCWTAPEQRVHERMAELA